MGRKTWVPLFIATSTSDPDSPLITSTLLPPTPRRTDYYGNRTSPTTSEEDAEEFMSPDGLGLHMEATIMSPQLDGAQPAFSTSGGATSGMSSRGGAAHVRQRSGMTGSPTLMVPGQGGEPMGRLLSLTSMMENKGDPDEIRRPSMSKYKAQIYSEKKRVANIIKAVLAFALSVLAIFCVSHILSPRTSTLSRISKSSAYDPTVDQDFDIWLTRVLPSLPSFSTIISLPTLETVPYPLSSHPRTPRLGDSVTLTDYLATRLGSHFSVPGAGTPSHLWYTSANNASVRLSAPHLRSFISKLDEDAEWKNAATRGRSKQPKRDLIILCLDEGCMEYCRGTDWFCYGGFTIGDKSLRGARMSKAREMVKMMATIETLRSGRRLFLVDGDVYFRDDPLLHMGNLDRYDMQITDAWSSSNTKAGFVYLNPTQSVISLWVRLLELARIDDDHESRLWATTNLLLDPFGHDRGFENKASFSGTKVFKADGSEDPHAELEDVPDGYGQNEFNSPWNNGTMVKILDKKRFKSSSGKVPEASFLREQEGRAAYFQCRCCEDAATANYIAGALGYHQPAVAFPAPVVSAGLPNFPMMVTTPTMNGTEALLRFTASLLLKLAGDTGRVFVPPLHTRIITKSNQQPYKDRYVWRLLPIARWAVAYDGGPARAVQPHYIQHAKSYINSNFNHLAASTKSLDELSETLWIDLADTRTYQDLLLIITRPFYSTTRVVTIENFEAVLGKPGWGLGEEIELCYENPVAEYLGGSCGPMCKVRSGRTFSATI